MERTWKPTTAGILSIVAGAPTAAGGIALALLGGSLGWAGVASWLASLPGVEIPPAVPGVLGGFGILLTAIAVFLMVPGIVAVVGGIHALKRRRWGLALAGSICALFANTLLGIASIVFVAMGREEFETAPAETGQSGQSP